MSVPDTARWIPGYERQYRITPDGHIWSYARAFPRPLKVRTQKDGLKEARLRKHGVESSYMLARLVLQVFGPPRPLHAVPIFHDRDRTNCAITNLRWGTASERQRHMGVTAKLTALDARRIFKSRRSAKVLAVEYHVSERTIYRIRRRRTWTTATRRLKGPRAA